MHRHALGLLTAATALMGVALPAHATDWVGGDWGGADLVVAYGDTLSGDFVNVGAFVVPVGVTVAVANGVPLTVNASSITVAGFLDADGSGFAGGGDCYFPCQTTGFGPGGGASGPSHGGGGGHAGVGGLASAVLGTGQPYGTSDDRAYLPMGSGGGAASYGYPWSPGGAGGGSVLLVAPWVQVDGIIGADGGNSYTQYFQWGSGGGSGGSITIVAGVLAGSGSISVEGGDFYDSWDYSAGSGGSGGRVKSWVESYAGSLSILTDAGLTGFLHVPKPDDGTQYMWMGTLILTAPSPGTAGNLNSTTVTGAAPNLEVYLAAHPSLGSAPIPGCSGFSAGVAAGAMVVGPVTADATGNAVFSGMVPPGQAGATWQLQAIQPGSCATSAVVPWTF